MRVKEPIVDALLANMYAHYLAFGDVPGGAWGDGPALKWVYTGRPVLNHVLGARFAAEDAAARVGEVSAMVRAWRAPALWWLDPRSAPPDLAHYAARCGWSGAGTYAGMARLLKIPPARPLLPTGVTIAPVADEPTLRAWARVYDADAPQLLDARADLFASLGLRQPWTLYLARLHGEAVGSGMLFPGGGVAGLYWIATLPGARRRGIGAALTGHLLRQAWEVGYRTVVLQATEMGAPLYRGLGFTDICTLTTLAYPG